MIFTGIQKKTGLLLILFIKTYAMENDDAIGKKFKVAVETYNVNTISYWTKVIEDAPKEMQKDYLKRIELQKLIDTNTKQKTEYENASSRTPQYLTGLKGIAEFIAGSGCAIAAFCQEPKENGVPYAWSFLALWVAGGYDLFTALHIATPKTLQISADLNKLKQIEQALANADKNNFNQIEQALANENKNTSVELIEISSENMGQ